MKLIHIDTAGPHQESFEGLRCVIVFVDSASRLQRPYGTRGKSTPVILAVVKYFVADMEVPRAFRTDNGSEYMNRTFTEYCDGLGIHRELTVPYTPQQNGPSESALARPMKAGLAARLEVNLERAKGVRDRVGPKLWLEHMLWAAEAFNRSATLTTPWMLSHTRFL